MPLPRLSNQLSLGVIIESSHKFPKAFTSSPFQKVNSDIEVFQCLLPVVKCLMNCLKTADGTGFLFSLFGLRDCSYYEVINFILPHELISHIFSFKGHTNASDLDLFLALRTTILGFSGNR
ncbi:hypothetical protein D5086_016513 [Populus alba]|uniref:Uncharacterized protein n=2 Tax=Populus TaxID=3689 RepID=A0ACC4BVF0_POPAL|nr:hypothetical protein NC653_021132 [Populus alba x Populus x berolinensis]